MNRTIAAFLLVLATVIAMVFLVVLLLAGKIPPDAMTITRMYVIESRIRHYYANEHRLPDSLSILPDDKRDGSVVDGWGRQIQYTTEGPGVRLLSFGRDGRLGGGGQDADISVTFVVSTLHD